jgi:hypothetical protein
MSNDINKIKKMIENALTDGVLSRQESEDIKNAILADKKVTQAETKLWQELQTKMLKVKCPSKNKVITLKGCSFSGVK